MNADERSTAESHPKETSTTEAQRHGKTSKATANSQKPKPQHREHRETRQMKKKGMAS